MLVETRELCGIEAIEYRILFAVRSGAPTVLWPNEPDAVYLSGPELHRIGQSSAVEAKDKQNFCKIVAVEASATFWAARACPGDRPRGSSASDGVGAPSKTARRATPNGRKRP